MHKRNLQILFTFILASLTAFNLWVNTQQPVWQWGGLTTPPDNLWTIATLIDAYYGFITFYVWVLWKETRALPRLLWFLAIMLLGNIAMAIYVLRQLARLKPEGSIDTLLSANTSSTRAAIFRLPAHIRAARLPRISTRPKHACWRSPASAPGSRMSTNYPG